MRLIGAGTREGFEYTVRHTFWTVPNVVTVLRFFLVPLFVWFLSDGEYMRAFWTLAILGATDWIDGFIARFFDQMSTVGRWLDPLADRVAMVIVVLSMVIYEVLPIWAFWAILIPDLVLFLNSAILFGGTPHLRVSTMGKVRTAVLMVALPVMLLAQTDPATDWAWGLFPLIAESIVIAACVMHVVASVDYLIQAQAKFRRLRTRGLNPWKRNTWVPGRKPSEPVELGSPPA